MKNETMMRNALLIAGFIVLLTVLIMFTAPSPTVVKLASDGFPLILSGIGTALSGWIFLSQRKKRSGARIWGAMTLGLAIWVVGEGLWTYYDFAAVEEIPYPSIADVAWLIGYIPLYVALLTQYLSLKVALSRARQLLIVTVSILMVIGTYLLVIQPILASPESGTPLEMFFNIAYPAGDILLLTIGTALILTFLGGRLALPWSTISAGILILSFSDLLFSYGTWNGLYYPDGQLNAFSAAFDTLYICAYVVWDIGLLLYRLLPEPGKEIDVHRLVDAEERAGESEEGDKGFLLMTDSEGRVVFIDSALLHLLGRHGAGEGLGLWFGDLVGMERSAAETAIGQARTGDFRSAEPIILGKTQTRFLLWIFRSSDEGHLPGFDILLQPENQQNLQMQDREAFLLSQIVHRTHSQEVLDRSSGDEQMLRIYFNTLVIALDILLSRTGGMVVGNAFESMLNREAGRLGCGFTLTRSLAVWSRKNTDPAAYRVLLNAAIQYAREVVQPETVDRILAEMEKYLDSRIIQAAVENNLRVARLSSG